MWTYKELQAVDEHGSIKTGFRLGNFLLRLDFCSLFIIFGWYYKSLTARGALCVLSAVLIFESNRFITIWAVKLNRHFSSLPVQVTAVMACEQAYRPHRYEHQILSNKIQYQVTGGRGGILE
jgi:hypothetical protein